MGEHSKTCKCGTKVVIFQAGITKCPKCDTVVWVSISSK